MPYIPNVPYSDIPRLVEEGKIKVGTRVKACMNQKKYPNVLDDTLRIGDLGTITAISDGSFNVLSGDERRSGSALYTEKGYLDLVLPDPVEPFPSAADAFLGRLEEKEEKVVISSPIYSPPKPLSFDEPLTKEAVGKFINQGICNRDNVEILDIGMTGNSVFAYFNGDLGKPFWKSRQNMFFEGWHFVSPEPETRMTLSEVEEKLGVKNLKIIE